MRTRSKFLSLLIILLIIVGLGFMYWHRHRIPAQKPLAPTAVTYSQPDEKPPIKDEHAALPPSLLIKVAFTPQAPTANWDELHNEACEEASSIMTNAYFNNVRDLPPEYVESEISKLTAWQDKNQGYHLDQTSGEVLKMLQMFYGLDGELDDLNETRIKEALADNKLVIISFNGQLLGNPHYKQPGPIHHMMVITGWNEKGFITNDPGTKFGQDYQYTYDTLQKAAADWDHNRKGVDGSKKFMLIISK